MHNWACQVLWSETIRQPDRSHYNNSYQFSHRTDTPRLVTAFRTKTQYLGQVIQPKHTPTTCQCCPNKHYLLIPRHSNHHPMPGNYYGDVLAPGHLPAQWDRGSLKSLPLGSVYLGRIQCWSTIENPGKVPVTTAWKQCRDGCWATNPTNAIIKQSN